MSDNEICWPCGCVTARTDGQTFTIRPCSTTCQVYRIALEESRKQGNLILTVPVEDSR